MRRNGVCRGLQRDGHWSRTSDSQPCSSSLGRVGLQLRPSELGRLAGFMLPSVVGAWPPLYALSDGSRAPISMACSCLAAGTSDSAASSESTSRRRDIGGLCVCAWPDLVLPFCSGASAIQTFLAGWSARLKRNTVPSAHIRCSTTPSLRATATTARFIPRRCATRMPQAFNQEFFALW